jgi:hypothetical protein
MSKNLSNFNIKIIRSKQQCYKSLQKQQKDNNFFAYLLSGVLLGMFSLIIILLFFHFIVLSFSEEFVD